MVGSTPTDTFGVAPDAEWIAAGVVDQGRNLNGTFSDILAAYQWALDPDDDPNTTDDVPDVILNSWGFPKGLFVPCDDTFWGVIDNVGDNKGRFARNTLRCSVGFHSLRVASRTSVLKAVVDKLAVIKKD